MKVTSSEEFKNKGGRLLPATRKKGVVTKIYGNGRSVDVYFVDNPQTIVKNVITSYSVAADLGPVAGTAFGNIIRCIVDVFDESNSRDMVVTSIY